MTRSRACAFAALLLLTPACQASRLQFRGDHRLQFVAPDARARVAVPVRVRWTMRGFEAVGLDGSTDQGRGAFAVFVDSAPMPVGKDVRWLARDDASCSRDPRCPSARYLADRGVFLTTQPELVLTTLPKPVAGRGDEEHHVNVVLVDGTGRRQRESAWYLPFTTKRRPA